jgi:hypothetical protein
MIMTVNRHTKIWKFLMSNGWTCRNKFALHKFIMMTNAWMSWMWNHHVLQDHNWKAEGKLLYLQWKTMIFEWYNCIYNISCIWNNFITFTLTYYLNNNSLIKKNHCTKKTRWEEYSIFPAFN